VKTKTSGIFDDTRHPDLAGLTQEAGRPLSGHGENTPPSSLPEPNVRVFDLIVRKPDPNYSQAEN